jgi:2-polyprenyl-6-methoxyphenol hydroxylase-like FAD-dependent oxidoreductase
MDLKRSSHRPEPRVLVVGAGPVGLVTALALASRGVGVHLVDRRVEPVSQSRATDIHPQTLSALAPYGVTDALVDIGRKIRRAVVHIDGRRVAIIRLGDAGAYPFALTVPQCTTEGVLQDHLASRGVVVETSTELVGLDGHLVADGAGPVVAHLARSDGDVTSGHYDWVIGCDGAHSTVRDLAGLDLLGAAATSRAVVADLVAESPTPLDEVHVFAAGSSAAHVLPMPVDGYVRVMVDPWTPAEAADPEAIADRVSRIATLDLRARDARWVSCFTMQRQVATAMCVGRVLLAGDAAHLCTPVGGQGMNSGVRDAVALAPLLASHLHGDAARSMLVDAAERRRRAALVNTRLAWWASRFHHSRVVRLAGPDLVGAAFAGLRPALERWTAGRLPGV